MHKSTARTRRGVWSRRKVPSQLLSVWLRLCSSVRFGSFEVGSLVCPLLYCPVFITFDWLQNGPRKNSVSVYNQGLLYHPRVQYIRTLFFTVNFFHFFYFFLDFTTEVFGLKHFRMRSVAHNPTLHFIHPTDSQV